MNRWIKFIVAALIIGFLNEAVRHFSHIDRDYVYAFFAGLGMRRILDHE